MTNDNTSVTVRREAVRRAITNKEKRAVRGDLSAKIDWQYYEAHQPTNGEYGAPCQGNHDTPTPWPCDTFIKMENPMFYMD